MIDSVKGRGTRWLVALPAALAIALSACGGGSEDGREPLFIEDPGPVHVHGLGISPDDNSLFIATHTGLWRLREGTDVARRVGDRFQDTMGFTIAAADRFLGSGHPDLRDADERGLPPLLGLVESRDGGLTWSPVSLLGEADFHVLRSRDERVYGFDATNLRLLVSTDAGRTWRERALPGFPPEPLVDFVVDPSDPRRLVASTERALYVSIDEGRSWQQVADAVDPAGGALLAWPAADTLVLLDGAGRMLVGAGPQDWRPVGPVGGRPAALLAQSPETIYVALHDGTIRRSRDGGVTWATLASP